MIKEDKLTPELAEQTITELTELWQQNDVVRYSQRIVNLRSAYRKGTVTQLLKKVAERLPQKPEQIKEGFKLFEIGDRIETIEAIYAGGHSNQQLAAANQPGKVIDNNHLDLNRYIAVQLDGHSHKIVANASQFRKRSEPVFTESQKPANTND